jgi:hypothetical protein
MASSSSLERMTKRVDVIEAALDAAVFDDATLPDGTVLP